ncbi:MAG TPA: alpha/beta hydrolase [Anaeromyxobacteraceae bacterium]|nr:alpha/beta hydrolase [Anaeromyxobacteraceae bacterium]
MRDPHPVHREVVANDLRHHVLEWDGGGRTTVLCLHGFLDLAWGFAPLGPSLAEAGYHVVAPDLRGHGDTDRVGAGGYYYFADYLLDVADLVDALARERLALVGHSMGGTVALMYAGVFPGRPERVAAMESIHMRPREESPVRRALEWIEGVRKARARGPAVLPTIQACAERIRRHDPRCPPDLALFLAERGTAPAPGGRAFKHDPLHLTRGPYPFRLDLWKAYFAAVACPVLLLDAAESQVPPPPDLAERLAAFARPPRRAVVPGAGHMMIRHQPAEVARLLLEFLEGR